MPFLTYSESVTTSTAQRSFIAPQPFDRRRQFHAVVGGVRFAAIHLLFMSP